jgi:hypothetical protein
VVFLQHAVISFVIKKDFKKIKETEMANRDDRTVLNLGEFHDQVDNVKK